jgi:nucleoside-diphosphate-sugar epimerase
MHILLTGAAGRIGSYTLTYLLDRGHTVTSSDKGPLDNDTVSKYPSTAKNHFEIDHSSISDIDRVFDTAGPFDGVIHIGAIPHPNELDWRVVHNNNVTSSYNVLYTAAKRGVKRISQASSVNATGMSFTRDWKQVLDELPLTEKETYRPVRSFESSCFPVS